MSQILQYTSITTDFRLRKAKIKEASFISLELFAYYNLWKSGEKNNVVLSDLYIYIYIYIYILSV